ncbi:hypothetical protein SEVIR_9G190200v4 [Setaria viridis]|uniref:Uncharacterized protein n=1 Tax=Setaria viridis TaxID=4556 RepID=A0A4U6SWJ1_SETVI|nr:hypothetical protein SEVIR_9G190200v2 [Setaria viridis]
MAAGAPVPLAMQRGGGSGPRVLVPWLLLAEYLQFDLRLWWALLLLLSVLAAAAHVMTSLDRRPLSMHSWALDAVSVVAAVVLLCAGLLGGREEGGSIAEEPLLNDVHEMADENNRSAVKASKFTRAGFLSVLTFSWMGPCSPSAIRRPLELTMSRASIPATASSACSRHSKPTSRQLWAASPAPAGRPSRRSSCL